MKGKRVKKTSRKQIFGVALALVLVLCAAGGTIAWLATATGGITNTFTAAEFEPDIYEDVTTDAKKDVKVQNKGDVEAYIRAAVIVNWVDANGDILPEVPVLGKDYTWSNHNTLSATNWVLGADGYYYYTQKVAKNGETGVLIEECKPKNPSVNGPYLRVTILSEGIQAVGVNSENVPAVVDAWGPTVVSVDAKTGALTINS